MHVSGDGYLDDMGVIRRKVSILKLRLVRVTPEV